MIDSVLIILGMHRSGTSLVANWLRECGLFLGDNLIEGHFSNIDGHFEDVDFHSMHEKILEECGVHKWGLSGLKELDLNQSQVNEIKELVQCKNTKISEWGWKDPRTCLFLDYYRTLIPNAKYFVVFRDAKNVVDSLLRRDVENIVRANKFTGVFSRVRNYLYEKSIRTEIYSKRYNEYLLAWKIHNYNIISHLRQIDERNYLVLNHLDPIDIDEGVINYLRSVGFKKIRNVNFSNVYKPELIKKSPQGSYEDSEVESISHVFRSLIDASILRIKSVGLGNCHVTARQEK